MSGGLTSISGIAGAIGNMSIGSGGSGSTPIMSMVMFQKSLQDLVKGIRSNKKDPSAFISQAIAEIKQELKSSDPFVKTQAVRKLTYLQMIGYDVSWAAFSIVEVMSQSRFAHKRIAYLAACQSFTDNTDVILLTTNLFKKEFGAMNQYDIGLAINCVANIVTRDLARDLLSDLVGLMTHTKPYVRKKAVLAMYKIYVKYPQALRLTFERLKAQLDDPDSSVVSCAVNVICELANKNPRNYLAMAPKFFRLLTTSSNNWMLIKVVKLLGSLVTEEPRLARKLLEPLATIIQNTAAKSLQYECIYTVTLALPYTKREDGTEARNVPAVIRLCADHLRGFIEDTDQNLKYLGLVGFVNLMRSNPRMVVEHRQLVLRCLHDDDVTIRTRALELLTGMVTRRSLQELVTQLLQHVRVAEGAYKDELVSKILFMCSRDKYSFLTDFAWYTSVLLELSSLQGLQHGAQIAEQFVEVALRVDTIRPYIVECMLSLLLNEELCLGPHRDAVSRILQAAAWIVGEYSDVLTEIANDTAADDDEENAYWIEGPANEEVRSDWHGTPLHAKMVDALLHPRVTNLQFFVQAAYIQAAFKIFLRASLDCESDEINNVIQIIKQTLGVFLQSMDLEVQERATTFRHVLAEFGILTFEQHDAPAANESKALEPTKPKPAPAPEPLLLLDPFMSLMDTAQHKSASHSLAALQSDDAPSLAKRHAQVLQSLISEPFYAVNSKAQKRVPIPEGLNLSEPFNRLAFEAIISITEPESKELSSISFSVLPTQHDTYRDIISPVGASNAKYDPVDEDERRMSELIGEAFDDQHPTPRGAQPTSGKSSKSKRSKDAELFYLSSANAGKVTVVAEDDRNMIRFDDDELEELGRSKKKGTRKTKKHSSKPAVNVAEMMPEGAVESSDEEGGKKKRRSRKAKRGSDDDDLELGDVDVTAPLRDDEVIPVSQHRKASESARVERSTNSATTTTDTNGKEKKKKTKSGKSSKKTTNEEADLLGFTPIESTSTTTSLLQDMEGLALAPPAPTKKSKDKPLWLPVADTGDVTLVATVQLDQSARQLVVRFRGTNNGSSPITDVRFVARSLPQGFAASSSLINVVLSSRVASNDTFEASIALNVTASPLATCTFTELCGNLRYSTEGLITESVEVPIQVLIPSAAFMRPVAMTESSFMDLLASSSGWAQAKVRINYSGKIKSVFRALGGYLNAQAIESEDTRAMSYCATHWAGATVAILCKRLDESTLAVDLKCQGAGAAPLCQSLATELARIAL